MTNTHAIVGIEGMPVFLVAENDPRLVGEDEFVSGVPLADLINRLQPGEHVYLVDYTSVPGQTRLTRLASRSDRD